MMINSFSDAHWTTWTPFSECSSTCQKWPGTMARSRDCPELNGLGLQICDPFTFGQEEVVECFMDVPCGKLITLLV